MRTIRIYVDAPLRAGGEVVLPERAARHAVGVLRLGPGDAVTLFNGDGDDYPARLVSATTREVRVRLAPGRAVSRESPLRITLAQAVARGGKMDWVVQKATELGVVRIVPLLTQRGEVRLEGARAARRVAHWRGVAVAACEQCGRNVPPSVDEPLPLEAWARSAVHGDHSLRLALLPDDGMHARDLAPPAGMVVLAVGPEGGFGERDVALLRDRGFRGLGLGPRILRTETAGLAAITALQALYGDL
jgi:16S rRNA (uracil1498-N3)-methyltransferase